MSPFRCRTASTTQQARDGRRPHDHRGSVLLFVLGVLLLMAVVATAFLASSRADRTAAGQNGLNTQADLLLDGIVNATRGRIGGDASVPGGALPGGAGAGFDASFGDGVTDDDWLASRVPTTADPNSVYAVPAGDPYNAAAAGGNFPAAGTNPAWWPAVSGPGLGSEFESPLPPSGAPGHLSARYSQRERLAPTYLSFDGRTWPALLVDTSRPPTNNADPATRFQKVLAADADGDGVADAGLFRIPVGELAGLTYFGAVRVIDNDAAVNVDTALSRDYDFAGDGTGALVAAGPLAGAFTSNVGLAEMLRSTTLATPGALPALPPQTGSAKALDLMSDPAAGPAGAGFAEFTPLFEFRTRIPDAGGRSLRPSGVFGGVSGGAADDASPYDDAVVAGSPAGPVGPRGTAGRPEFQFASIGDMLRSQIGGRVGRPGVTRYTAGTPTDSVSGRSAFVDGLGLAARFSIGFPDDADAGRTSTAATSLAAALAPSLGYGPNTAGVAAAWPGVPLRTRPYDGDAPTGGVGAWFTTHFDYLAESPADASTFMNRRTILTAASGLSDVTGDVTGDANGGGAAPPDYLFDAKSPQSGQWSGTGVATATGTGTTAPLVARAFGVYEPRTPGIGPPTVPMTVVTRTRNGVATGVKASVNTARFEELFYAFFRTTAGPKFRGLADDQGTPFSGLYDGDVNARTTPAPANTAVTARNGIAFAPAQQQYAKSNCYYDDPYVGSRFVAASDFPARREPAGFASVVNGQRDAPEQHPLRMFRSPLRAAHNRDPLADPSIPESGSATPQAYWNTTTPRLPADQVLVLRAALAAANLEALRDSSHNPAVVEGGANDRVTPHQVPLTAMIDGTPTAVVAHVYGLRRQPYITEVYANTGNGPDPTGKPANPMGYVAIKLYNPYAVPIGLRHCRLVGLRRLRDPGVTTQPPISPADFTQYPNMRVFDLATPLRPTVEASTDQLDLGTAVSNLDEASPYWASPCVVPPGGVLVLENYRGDGKALTPAEAAVVVDDARHRPASVGGGGVNAVPPTGTVTPANAATVNFAYVPGLQRVVWDRELVLMRPPGCTPPDPAGVPANVVEYAGDPLDPTPPSVARMVPLDTYDFTGLNVPNVAAPPARTRAEAWYYRRAVDPAAAWKWVYPGRYDADQSIVPVGSTIAPGPRQQGTVRAVSSDGHGVGWDPANPEDPFVDGPVSIPGGPAFNVDPAAATAEQKHATYPDELTIQLNADGWPGDRPLHDPTAAGAGPNGFPFGGFRRLGDLLDVPFVGSYTLQTETDAGNDTATRFLEINAVTSDAAFAEDTDPADNERPTDDGTQSREQVGRFVPLRPSRGDGTPAVETRDPVVDAASPAKVSAGYDTAFDADNGDGASLDPIRYRDDAADDTLNPLPGRPLPSEPTLSTVDAKRAARVNRYRWARALFDHFTISSPHDDSFPNYPTQPKWRPHTAYAVGDTVQLGQDVFVCRVAHRSGGEPATGPDAPGGGQAPNPEKPPAGNNDTLVPPVDTVNWKALARSPLANGYAKAGSRSDRSGGRSDDYFTGNDLNEVALPTAGLINLNTAPEKVLAALPWCPRTGIGAAGHDDVLTVDFSAYPNAAAAPFVTAGGDGIDDNAQIAHLITLYRDGAYSLVDKPMNDLNFTANLPSPLARATGPFTSMWDLYRVPGFRLAQDALLKLPATTYPRQTIGDDSPPFRAADPFRTDGAAFDFEKQALLMSHVSNLVTTRSDFFTVYALVQGWRGVGTDRPQLVVQRRAAFVVDRSAATAASPTLVVAKVPVN